jgi:hypothetical protein
MGGSKRKSLHRPCGTCGHGEKEHASGGKCLHMYKYPEERPTLYPVTVCSCWHYEDQPNGRE